MFRQALASFPDSKPPADVDRRLRIYRAGKGIARRKFDSEFWSAREAIERDLAGFIRANRDRFAALDQPCPVRETPHPKEHEEPPREGTKPSVVGELPHWARVAFAARCARHVLPIFEANWPEAPESRRQSLTNAIRLAEESAANGKPSPGLQDAATEAITTAGEALSTLYGIPLDDDEIGPSDGNMATAASFAANAAGNAAEVALSSPAESEQCALRVFKFAMNAAGGDNDLRERMYDDLGVLLVLAEEGKWSDKTRIPPDVF